VGRSDQFLRPCGNAAGGRLRHAAGQCGAAVVHAMGDGDHALAAAGQAQRRVFEPLGIRRRKFPRYQLAQPAPEAHGPALQFAGTVLPVVAQGVGGQRGLLGKGVRPGRWSCAAAVDVPGRSPRARLAHEPQQLAVGWVAAVQCGVLASSPMAAAPRLRDSHPPKRRTGSRFPQVHGRRAPMLRCSGAVVSLPRRAVILMAPQGSQRKTGMGPVRCSAAGGVAEWSNALVLKTRVGPTRPRVRIPPPPLGYSSAVLYASAFFRRMSFANRQRVGNNGPAGRFPTAALRAAFESDTTDLPVAELPPVAAVAAVERLAFTVRWPAASGVAMA
jgi:hypothetical protein